MTKQFLLLARGVDVAQNEALLADSMNQFNTTLYDLKTGNAGRGILQAPTQQVASMLADVLTLWEPFEELLRSNKYTIRAAGAVNMGVLESVANLNVPLLDASNAVVSSVVDAAKVSGAETNGLTQNIAGRQRTYIQQMCKDALFVSLGVALTTSKDSLTETKKLFEASHKGVIEGVPFAGVPVLTKMCTLDEMSWVTYNYQQLRPLYNEILNEQTASQETASAAAAQVAELTGPLFDSMVQAVELFNNDQGSCDPLASMTAEAWQIFFRTLGNQRVFTQEASQFFTQLALDVDVKSSQVEITVLLSTATENLRNLIEGSRSESITPPPTQPVVDHLLLAWELWSTLSSELGDAVRLDSVSNVMVARVAQLSAKVLLELDFVLRHAVDVANSTAASVASRASQQPVLVSQITQAACLVKFGQDAPENWARLNATLELLHLNHWALLQGDHLVPKVTDVCIVQQMKRAADLFAQLEVASLGVAHGDAQHLEPLVRITPLAVDTALEAALALNSNASCGNSSLAAQEWRAAHAEVATLQRLSQEVTAKFLVQQGSQRLESVQDLDTSWRRVMFGSWQPAVAAPSSQAHFDELLQFEPAVASLKAAVAGTDAMAVLAASDRLMEAAGALQSQYLANALGADPTWPGRRVDVAIHQITLANKVFKEAVLFVFDLRTTNAELSAVIGDFDAAHLQLKDGGDGVPPIMIPERNDLLDQWNQIDSAWQGLKQFKDSMTSEDGLERAELGGGGS